MSALAALGADSVGCRTLASVTFPGSTSHTLRVEVLAVVAGIILSRTFAIV